MNSKTTDSRSNIAFFLSTAGRYFDNIWKYNTFALCRPSMKSDELDICNE